jgi:hypothetical protein
MFFFDWYFGTFFLYCQNCLTCVVFSYLFKIAFFGLQILMCIHFRKYFYFYKFPLLLYSQNILLFVDFFYTGCYRRYFNHELLASCRTRKKYLKNSMSKNKCHFIWNLKIESLSKKRSTRKVISWLTHKNCVTFVFHGYLT